MSTDPNPTSSLIKTRFLILSDTHSASPSSSNNASPFRLPLPRADVLLHCGDLTMAGHLHEYDATLAMLGAIDADLKLVIAGNHDISLDEQFYRRRGQSMQGLERPDPDMYAKAREMWTGERARRAGVTFLDEGVWGFVLGNGARLRVYASPYQPEFCDWAFPYNRTQDRFNPAHSCSPGAESIATNPVPDFPTVDVVMTHGPPLGIRDETALEKQAVGCEHLLRAVGRCRPRLHCFGHIHEGWGAERVVWGEGDGRVMGKEEVLVDREKVEREKVEREGAAFVDARELVFGKETLMVNASIMTVGYEPVQGPWVVDLDLERAVQGEE
ncbi:Metallo-dependent phosphatase-like protein [Massariosphaeria phaeospora]|uniref:Metallo-dependent phosphatase-like protein n=1 Tax=Massariosphaeria phaeospora TaxID=100035 RepID=A0A7C8M283_9PLEO|nr:Metallo-dependent phosphatase-like protein [Massariosphaeria phaeospora]